MRIVIPNDWNDAFARSPLLAELLRRGTVSVHKGPGPEQEAALAEAEVVVGIRERTWFLADRLAKMPNLKMIAQIGGTEAPHIDVGVATQRGVLLCHTAGLAPASNVPKDALNTMAELAIGMMIAAQRQFTEQDRVIRAGGGGPTSPVRRWPARRWASWAWVGLGVTSPAPDGCSACG
jgi:phosphoglycerate dehydrogenase-like enzyme